MNRATDTLIIGAGLSGLYTALMIDSSREVLILVKTALAESNSNLAQGGIAAEMKQEKALIEDHISDTLTAGSHANDPQAVRVLVEEAQLNIEQLMAFNVAFDMDKEGDIRTTREGGHTRSRVLHSGGDATGRDMINALQTLARHRPNITIVEQTTAVDFLMEDGRVTGLLALDENGKTTVISADNIVLATGGLGAIYASTTNAPVATGDGIAMTARAGGLIEKMAFIQFHPTAFFHKDKKTQQKFLITEALRGEGAILRNFENEAFMEKYHPQGDLAPRDIVSQAIFREMYDTWSDHVYLDTRHLDPLYLASRFPTITAYCKEQGFVLGHDLIPVAPVQHFNIGGIKTDLEGLSSIDNVYAVGENASTGVHGANRLAANSLLECVVFGRRIANHINKAEKKRSSPEPLAVELHTYHYDYTPIRKKLGMVMEEQVGIVRKKNGLETAKHRIQDMRDKLLSYPNHSPRYYETLNMVEVALMIIDDALRIPESKGCHFRLD